MEQFTFFAQAANYNCSNASDSSYGAGSYSTCSTESTATTATATTSPGAPNTGEFFGFMTTGAFSIILPLVVAIAIVSAATVTVIRKKRIHR